MPPNATTMLSVGEWLVPQESDEIAVSTWRAPCSTARYMQMLAMPTVVCEWNASGSLTAVDSAVNSSTVRAGVSNPAMSLMAMEWQPMASSCFACSTKCWMVCTGLVV